MIVAIFAVPIAITVGVCRWVTKVLLRRRFFATAPPRIPVAKVVPRGIR
jgi:hypothetical protein